MRFHLMMMMVVVAVSFAMHAMASAGEPGPVRAEAYQNQVRSAGADLNRHLKACREHAQRQPRASQRELKACERTAGTMFRHDVRQARKAGTGQAG